MERQGREQWLWEGGARGWWECGRRYKQEHSAPDRCGGGKMAGEDAHLPSCPQIQRARKNPMLESLPGAAAPLRVNFIVYKDNFCRF